MRFWMKNRQCTKPNGQDYDSGSILNDNSQRVTPIVLSRGTCTTTVTIRNSVLVRKSVIGPIRDMHAFLENQHIIEFKVTQKLPINIQHPK